MVLGLGCGRRRVEASWSGVSSRQPAVGAVVVSPFPPLVGDAGAGRRWSLLLLMLP